MSGMIMDVRARVRHRREDPGESVGGHGRTKEGGGRIKKSDLRCPRNGRKSKLCAPGGLDVRDVHGAEDEQGARVGPRVGRADVEDLDLVHHGRVEAGAG